MTTCAPTLLELQRAFQRDLFGSADGGATEYIVSNGVAPQARLAIYRNTANGALLRALQLSYPAVQALVGAEFFEGAARLFIEQCLPSSAQLDSYGATFPDFLAQLPQAASLDYLPDTARLEWAVNEVLHAPDSVPLDLRRLEQWDKSDSQSVQFVASPSVSLLQSTFPVDAIWQALLARDDEALTGIDLNAGPVWLLVSRTAAGVEVKQMSREQWLFTGRLFSGVPLDEALTDRPDSDAHVWLASLFAWGSFADIRLSGPACSPSIEGLVK